MKKHLPLLLFIGLMLAGVVSAVYFGLRPRPVPKIRISGFENLDVFARSLILRLNEEIKAANLLVVGYEDVGNQAELWQKFIEELKPAGLAYDLVFVDSALRTKEAFPTKQEIDFQFEGQQFPNLIRNSIAQGARILIILPQTQSSLKAGQSYANYLKASGFKLTAFTTATLLRSREQENQMQLPCKVEGLDESGLGPLGCLILQRSRAEYRKDIQAQFAGTADLIGMNDYLILLSRKQ